MVELKINGQIKSELVKKDFLEHFKITDKEYKLFLNEKLLEHTRKGNLEAVNQYLLEGADKNFKDKEGKTALIIASERNKIGIVKLLLSYGADINIKDHEGVTALAHASFKKGNTSLVNLLLARGANPNIRDNNGDGPLQHARQFACEEVAEILIGAGAAI